MTELGIALLESIEKSLDWSQGEYTFDNRSKGIQIWTTNIPILHLSVYKPAEVSLSWHDKIKLYFAIKKYNSRVIINKLKETK